MSKLAHFIERTCFLCKTGTYTNFFIVCTWAEVGLNHRAIWQSLWSLVGTEALLCHPEIEKQFLLKFKKKISNITLFLHNYFNGASLYHIIVCGLHPALL